MLDYSKSNHSFYAEEKELFQKKFLKRFMNITHMSDEERDEGERRTATYDKLNDLWADIWKQNYNSVELSMINFCLKAPTNPDEAVSQHKEWLINNTQNNAFFL